MLSCTEHWEDNLTNDGKLSTTISVVLPQIPDALPQTRAMAMNPQMENLYLAVFDENGYLLEYVKADATTEMASENEKTYKYKVSLTPTDFPTYVHFIGNAPKTISFGTEVEAVGKLFTEGGDDADAYWQRIVFPNGIKKNSDGTLEASVLTALQDVRLVRNFAWIKLQLGENVKNFTIDSYCVMNTRTKGSVAPYNTSRSQFADFAHRQTYADLISEGYNGFIPADAQINDSIPAEDDWFLASSESSDENYAYFVYEREKALSNPPFILMKGYYNGNTEEFRYYKVDLRDNQGNYFPIIRNFRYNIVISSIMHEGHATAAAAVAGAGSGDVSTAIETEDYTNISNNVARIFVSYTDTTLVNQMNDLKLRYKFMVFETKDGNGNVVSSQQVLNDSVTIKTDVAGTVIRSYTIANDDAADGWREITISTTGLGASRKSQDIIIKGQVTIGEGANAKTYQLQRKVTLNLRPKYTMQLVCNPTEIQRNLGEPFDLIIKVPGGLGSAMFPLEFQLEAEAQSMTPNLGDDLPVVTGSSIIAGKSGKTTIGFIKHLEWDVYNALPNEGGHKSVVCHFKSNKAASATAIYAQNKYFIQASTTLGNYTPSTFSNLTFNHATPPQTADAAVTFTFTMSRIPEQGYVTVALSGLEPANDETRLTYVGVVDGKAGYSFNPSDDLTETLKLKTTDANLTSVEVALSAYHFEDASASLVDKIIIRAGRILVGNRGNNIDFYLYTDNPEEYGQTANRIDVFTASNGGSNPQDIDVTDKYKDIPEDERYVYVQYRTWYYYYYRYYVAKVKLENLLTGPVTLDFEEQ